MTRFLLRSLGLLTIYIWWIEPAFLRIIRHEVSDPGQPLANPIRVLLLTDWHLGRWTRPRVLRAKIERLLRLHRRQPFDLVLLGGDFIDADARLLPPLTEALRHLGQMTVPIMAVLGNHDYTSFSGKVVPLVECLEAQGIVVLRNQAKAVEVGGQRLLIVGLDDLQEDETYYQAERYQTPSQYRQSAAGLDWYAHFNDFEPDTPRLLLAHNPDAVYLPGRKPLAVLAGHTHGGQVIILDWLSRPFHRQLNHHLPPGSLVTWAGQRVVNDRRLIVSRGMEGAALPLRFLRPPEAIVLTLR
jgi:predicted MPP superfamily phosphohydrolase